MAKFFANLLDQLDFAIDHVILDDINYKRLALILVDNVMELTLHRYAGDRSAENRYRRDKPKHDPGAVAAALGQDFKAKVKFARLGGLLGEDVAASIETLHGYRNQLYHRGVMHEPILPTLAVFYFRITCDVLADFRPVGYGWSNRDQVPHRAVKYIGRKFDKASGAFPAAWARLREVSENIPIDLAADLHRHMEETLSQTNELIDYLVKYDPENETRDKVVRESQAWAIAFTEEGKKFARDNGASTETVAGYVDWIAANYPWDIPKDPAASWTRRLSSLKNEPDEHKALRKYTAFMAQTQTLREAVEQSAAALDQHVEEQIERARGG